MRSLYLDLRFPGAVGRLKRAIGSDSAEMLEHYRHMCRTLAAGGRVDILLSLKAGTVTFAEVWDLYRPLKGRGAADLSRLPSPETLRRLWATDEDGREVGAFADWLAGEDWSRAHRDNVARDLLALRRLAKPTATVADVPELVRKARKAAVRSQQRRAFNMVRGTAHTFCLRTLGRRHELTLQVEDVEPLTVKRKPTSGLEPADAQAVRHALNDGQTTGHGEDWWALCCTGMRPAEYWREGAATWRVLADRVEVHPSKTDGEKRPVPLLDRRVLAAAPHVSRRALAMKLHRLSGGEAPYAAPWPRRLSLYDARRTFRHWCELAGIPDSRAKIYRSEAPRTVDELYKQHAIVAAHLAADTATLRAYLGLPDTDGLSLVRGA